eukprot:162391_1
MSWSFRLTQITLSIFIAVFCATLFIVLLIKLNSNTKPMHKLVNFFSSLVLICLCVAAIIEAIGLSYQWADYHNNRFRATLLSVYAIIWTISFISSYMFLVVLLYYSFKGSAYQISMINIIFHTLIALTVFALVVVSIYFQYALDDYKYAFTLIIIEISIYIFGLCQLTYILNKKLLLLVTLNSDGKTKMNQRQLKLVQTVTKLTVLLSIYVVSTISYVIITVICGVYSTDLSELIDFCAYTVASVVGVICIFLTFWVNNSNYICLCNQCDMICSKLCRYIAQSKIAQSKMKGHLNVNSITVDDDEQINLKKEYV